MGNLQILQETLQTIQSGRYLFCGAEVFLKESPENHRKAVVVTAEEAEALVAEQLLYGRKTGGKTSFSVSNQDSYEAAVRLMETKEWKENPGKALVLNFANPVNPGGGVRRGAMAQEEDLCRRSTLLSSLESREAWKFYENHRKERDPLATDAMILSPFVEIFRKGDGRTMKAPVTVSVLTCAAPALGLMARKPDKQTLEEIFLKRIQAMLHVACGYPYLILGAWGCGAFGNDAKLVAEQFYRAFQEFRVKKKDGEGEIFSVGAGECFRRVEFAVLDRSWDQYNFRCFSERFSKEG